MNQKCLTAMRTIYAEFTGTEISDAIKLIRAEMTVEEERHALQVEILKKQEELKALEKRHLD